MGLPRQAAAAAAVGWTAQLVAEADAELVQAAAGVVAAAAAVRFVVAQDLHTLAAAGVTGANLAGSGRSA